MEEKKGREGTTKEPERVLRQDNTMLHSSREREREKNFK